LARHPDVMRRFGFDAGCTWKLYLRSGIAVDLGKDPHIDGIVERAVRRKLANRYVRVAEAHDLIAMKLRADRPQDDYDVAEIIRAGTIDEATVAARVDREQLARFRQIRKRIDRNAD
jgi:hypothetical protein